MRITNVQHLPDVVVKLVANGRTPTPNTISVTELLKPPQQRALEVKHWNELEEDAADRMWASYGSLVHMALEKIGADNALQEERLSIDVDGWTVHGTPDLYEADGTITDFKFVSVWTAIGGVKPEWIGQVNLYAYLLREHGFDVNAANIVLLYRDWSKNRIHDDGYPQTGAETRPVPLWSADHARSFLDQRLLLHRLASEGNYQLCTPEERWQRPTVWAVTKAGNKRASRLLDTAEGAEAWAADNVPANKDPNLWFEITERPGANVRCESYCAVARFCSQFQEEHDERD